MAGREEELYLFMQLDVGLKTSDLFEAEILLGQALEINMVLQHDLELGGAYFAFEPEDLPNTGISDLRLRQNYIAGSGWRVPHRQDLPLVAEINLAGTDLLEIGRVATTLNKACGDQCSVCGYVVSVRESSEFWRAHWVELTADIQATPSSILQLSDENIDTTQSLLCYLAFGLECDTLSEAKNLAESIFNVSFEEYHDPGLNYNFLAYIQPSSSEVSTLRLRENSINQWSWLYPNRKDCKILLELVFDTSNLLDLGRIAANLEDQWDQVFQPMAYRVVGDLLRDYIPRLLKREFSSKSDALSKWRLGHPRHQDNQWIEEVEEE